MRSFVSYISTCDRSLCYAELNEELHAINAATATATASICASRYYILQLLAVSISIIASSDSSPRHS
jgi:hypothetical protein